MGRSPTLGRIRTGNPTLDRIFDALTATFQPIVDNPLFAAADFRLGEVAGSGGGSPSFVLQYRTPGTTSWTTILILQPGIPLVLVPVSAPAGTPADGSMWVEKGTDALRVQINGVTKTVVLL